MIRSALLAVLIWTFTIPVFAQEMENENGKFSIGDYPPPLNVKFVKRKPVTLMDSIGKKVIIVEFWATWCAPCKYSIPHLTSLQKKYGKDGLVIIGISEESITEVQPFVEDYGSGMNYTVAVDKYGDTKKRYFDGYGLEDTIPQAFVIDVNGRIAWQGHPNSAFLDKLIPVLLEDIPEKEEVSADE